MPSYTTQAMSIKITEKDIGRKFVTKGGDVRTIKDISEVAIYCYPVSTLSQSGRDWSYTIDGKYYDSGAESPEDFSHWLNDAPTRPRTPEWWATFNAILPAVYARREGRPDYEKMVAIATQITNEAHK